jgi:DNA-binding SARP family transcriptional activator
VHRRGANLPDIKEAFWPDATNRRAGERLQTEAGDLRARIRDAYWAANPHLDPGEDKRPPIDSVVNTGGRYHLNPDIVDVDWWTVQDALAAATTDTAHRAQHLHRAVDAYGGLLADGCSYDWLPDVAEHVRRQGIIAYTQLAQLLVDTDPGEAARLLDQATALDPINEELARAAMRTHARVHNADAVRAQLHRIRAALDEIDAEPDEATTTLAAELLRQITCPAPKPRPRPPQDEPPP